MTENEIKEFVAEIRQKSEIFRNSGFATTGITNVFDKSADIIEELLPYMAIGTIEEFKALKEKNTPKKPLFIKRSFTQFYACPHCSTNEHYEKVFSKMKHCENCGGTFDWQ